MVNDVSRVTELLSESLAFYDAEMISELMNTIANIQIVMP